MSIAIVGDNLIHYEAIGRGEPVVFVHGWLGSWRYWWPSMQALSTRHRAFAFDLWGFGDSSKSTSNYSFQRYVEMLDQFFNKLGISQPITVVAHTLGAAVALRYANENPGRVERLVAVAMPVKGSDVDERLSRLEPQSYLSRVLGKNNNFPEVDAEIKKTDARAFNASAQDVQQLDLAAELDRCACPLLLIYGQNDPVISRPADSYLEWQGPAQGRRFIALDECSHFPMLEQPAKFNRLVHDFIQANGDLTRLAPKEYWSRRTY